MGEAAKAVDVLQAVYNSTKTGRPWSEDHKSVAIVPDRPSDPLLGRINLRDFQALMETLG